MPEVDYGSNTITYDVIRTDRKTVGLEVDVEDGILVRAPNHLSSVEIKRIVKKKADWIQRKQKKVNEIKPAPQPKEFLSGEKLPYLGRRYRLQVSRTNEVKKASVKLYQGKFQVQVNSLLEEEARRLAIRAAFIAWYRKRAEVKINERVEKYKTKIGVEPNNVKIKKQKKRWGSCSSKGNLNFNWKLIMAPMSIIDYLVVHELAHLKYSNHSRDFWNLVGALVPDYEGKQEWLRINGRQLTI